MLKSTYQREKQPFPDYDEQISDWITRWSWDGDGRLMTIAIESPGGFLYGIIETYDGHTYAALVSFLKSIGLKNRTPLPANSTFDDRFYP